MTAEEFSRLSKDDLQARFDPSDPWSLCPVHDREGIHAHFERLSSFHIDYLLAGYKAHGLEPSAELAAALVRHTDTTKRRYGLMAVSRLSRADHDLLQEIRNIIVTSANQVDRDLAADALLHCAIGKQHETDAATP